MEIELGIVCGRCDWYSPMKTATCPSCGHGLALFPRNASVPPTARDAPVASGALEHEHARESADTASSESSQGSAEGRKPESSGWSEPPSPSAGLFLDPLRPRRG